VEVGGLDREQRVAGLIKYGEFCDMLLTTKEAFCFVELPG
jgi:hypothetical protein